MAIRSSRSLWTGLTTRPTAVMLPPSHTSISIRDGMSFARIIVWSTVVPLAIGGWALVYCIEKARLAAGSSATVGDDVIVLGYVTTTAATLMSGLATIFVRRETVAWRALPVTALFVCGTALGCWAWLHLSGVIVPYSATTKKMTQPEL